MKNRFEMPEDENALHVNKRARRAMRGEFGRRIAIWYAVLASLWILLSDQLLVYFAPTNVLPWLNTAKGWMFVGVTSVALWFFLQKNLRRFEQLFNSRTAVEQKQLVLAQRLEHLMRNASDIIILADETEYILEANDRAIKAYGYSLEEFRKLKLSDLRAIEARPGYTHKSAELLARGQAIYETVNRRKDGSNFPVDVSVTIVEIEGKKYRLGIVRDATGRKAQEREIERLTRFYKTLSEVNQTIVRAQTRQELFGSVCEIAVRDAGFSLAWIGWRDLETEQINPVAYVGEAEDYLNSMRIYADERLEGFSPLGACICENKTQVFNGKDNDPRAQAWIEDAKARGFYAAAALPLRVADKPCGVLAVYAAEQGFFQEKEMALLEEMAMDISHALDRLEEETRRRTAETALAEEVMRRRILIDQSNDGIVVLDEKGRVQEANQRFAAMLGYSVEEVSRLHVWNWDSQWDREKILDMLDHLGREGARFETQHRRKDGTLYEVEVSASAAYFGGQKHIFSLHRDITARKRAEERLRQLSRGVEQSPASIVITDLKGAIEYVNPKFTELTGYSFDEVRGKNPRILRSGETSQKEYAKLWQTIKAGGEWRGEFHNKKKNGELFCEFARISPIFDEEGRATHFIAVKEDITERKRLETQIRQVQKLEAIGQLAGGVAHDFNNILAASMMQLGLLQQKMDLDEETRDGLAELVAQTTRAANLTRQLLLFGRRSVMRVETLDLNEVVENLLKMLRRLIGEDINLQWVGCNNLPKIFADAGMVEQVVMNLAINARDAMPRGGKLTLATERVNIQSENELGDPNATTGTYAKLTVSDSGMGMDEMILKRIFEPFFTTKEPGKGTGLGLATVYSILQQHRGWVTVKSALGAGTVFSVFLPSDSGFAQKSQPTQTEIVAGGKEIILVVEDDAAVRKMMCRYLARRGYHVLEAANGREALNLWSREQKIDLLFTDMVMPEGISGLDLAEKLVAERPELKVILTSGYSNELLHQPQELLRNMTFLAKPCQPSEVAAAIRRCFDDKA